MIPAPSDRMPPRSLALDAAWIATAAAAALPLVLNLAIPGGLSPLERAAAAAVVLLAAWRPLDALLVTAAFAPLGISLGAVAGSAVSVTDWLLPATLLGSTVAGLRGRVSLRDVPPWLSAAALALAWLALASVAVQVLRDRVWFETALAWRDEAWSFLSADFFSGHSRWRSASSGIALAGQALVVPLAAALALRHDATRRVAAMMAAGAIGAAAQNVLRVVEGAVRSGDPWVSLVAIAQRARISAAFNDANAAGSYFALVALLVAGFLWDALRARRWRAVAGWTAAFLVTGAALYLTGSRVALAVILPAAVAALVTTRGLPRLTPRTLAVLALVIVVTIALVATAQSRRGRNDAPVAAFVRMEFFRTTGRMLAEHPAFGVGVGAYLRHSGQYSSDALRRIYRAQNAHNNFLQVAGELGSLGLAAFLLVVGLPPWRAWREAREAREATAPLVLGLWAGTIAFLLTCLGGHPLLVPEVAASFAVALGVLAAMPAPAAGGASPRLARGIERGLLLVALLLAVSLPVRVRAERAGLDLEYAVLGTQRWVVADGSVRVAFRGRIAYYVVGDGHLERMELRPAGRSRRPIDVTVRLDGTVANIIRLAGPDWKPLTVLIPREGRRRFRILSLETSHPPDRGGPRVVVQRPVR